MAKMTPQKPSPNVAGRASRSVSGSSRPNLENKIADQVKSLEARVAKLEKSAATSTQKQRYGLPMTEFVENFSGIFENDPIFEEAMRLGAEWRASDRPKQKPASRKRVRHARARQ